MAKRLWLAIAGAGAAVALACVGEDPDPVAPVPAAPDGAVSGTEAGTDGGLDDAALLDGAEPGASCFGFPPGFGREDPTFNVATKLMPDSFVASAAGIDAEGRVLVAGVMDCNGQKGFAVTRFRADGTSDAEFAAASSGTACADIPQVLSVTAVSELDDGRVIVGGSAGTSAGTIARFSQAGVEEQMSAILPNGSIIGDLEPFGNKAVGAANVNRGPLVFRFNSDGSKDGALNRILDAGTTASVRVDATGGIVVTSNTGPSWAVTKMDPSGKVPADFGNDGGTIAFDAGSVTGKGSALEGLFAPDGKIVVTGAGSQEAGGGTGVRVLRLTSAGAFDDSFKPVPLPLRVPVTTRRLTAVQCDRKVVILGTNAAGKIALVRLLEGGGLDVTFGTGGMLETNYTFEPMALLQARTGHLLIVVRDTRFTQEQIRVVRVIP